MGLKQSEQGENQEELLEDLLTGNEKQVCVVGM